MTSPDDAEDLITAMVGDAMETARPLVSGYAGVNRRIHGKLERPTGRARFDRVTEQWTDPPRDLIYSGPARLWPVSSHSTLGPDEAETDVSTTTVSINSVSDGKRPQINDMFTVFDDEVSRELEIAGQVFTVEGVSTGGQFGYGWHLALTGVNPSPNDPEDT